MRRPAGGSPCARWRARASWGPGAPTVLAEALDAVRSEVEDPAWQAAKARLLERLQAPGFWDDPGRFAVLDGAEVHDRIEAGLSTARSLLERLRGFRGERRPPADVVRRAAQRALLLSEAVAALAAGEPADAVLAVEGDAEFGERVAAMYRRWARERGMRLDVLEEEHDGGYRLTAAVSGFAALQVLRREVGLHVLEVPAGEGKVRRQRVRVGVAADPPNAPGARASADAAAARRALAATDGGRARIVRRYREQPAPLVRDAARGWRTGRLDDVLAGGFDLMEP